VAPLSKQLSLATARIHSTISQHLHRLLRVFLSSDLIPQTSGVAREGDKGHLTTFWGSKIITVRLGYRYTPLPQTRTWFQGERKAAE